MIEGALLRDLGVGLQRDTCLYNRTIGRARSESSLQPVSLKVWGAPWICGLSYILFERCTVLSV